MQIKTILSEGNPAAKGFLVQYISLMLIILVILAGVLSRPVVSADSLKQRESGFLELSPVSDWQPIFNSSDLLTDSALSSRISVLSNHDLVLEIKITSASIEEVQMWESALWRKFSNYYEGAKVGPHNIRLTYIIEQTSRQLAIQERWYRTNDSKNSFG